MKYEVVKGCVIKGVSHRVGDTVDVDDKLAESLMGIGRLVPASEEKTVNRAVGAEGSEDKPKKRAPRKAKAKA
tara:strand:+ start:243 stop:461 length:219 start_codon:yes stop_codon:yes gene_type:complete